MKQIPKYKEVSKKYSNMNVEVGEKTLLPTGLLVDHGGDKHSEGGTDVNLPEGAMIFSNAMKLDKSVVALLLNKDKSKVKRMTPAELAKKYATNELLESIESPDKYKANSAKLMLEKNIAQLNSIFQAQEEYKKVNGIESGKTLAEQGMKAEYGTAKYGGVAQGGNVVGGIDLNSLYKLINPYSPAFENVGTGYDDITDYNYDPTQNVLTRDTLLYEAPNNLFDPEGKVLKDPQVTKELGMQTAFRGYPDSKQGMYSFDYGVISPAYRDDMQSLSSENISHLFQGLPDHNHPAQDTYNKHYSTILVDKDTNDKYFVVPGGVLSNASIPEGFIPISPEEAVQRKDSFKAYYSEPGKELETDWSNPSVAKPNAFAHEYNYDDLVKSVSRTTKWKVGDDGSYQEVTPNVPSATTPNKSTNSTIPEVPKKPMTDYAIKSHNQIAADLYRKLFSAEMQAPYEIFNPGIASVVRPAYQSTAPVQQALNNLSYTLDNSNASTQYGNALYADGLAKSLESSNQISRYNQQAAMEAEQKNTGNLVNTFNQNQQGFAANANANNINFLKAKDRYEHYKDDLFSRVLENQVDRNTYEGMLQDRRLTERYSPSELLDNGAWNNFFDPQRYMQFDNKDTLNPDNGQKLASLSQDELTQLKTARDNETDPTLKAKLWELYLKAIESKSQSGGYLKKKGSYQTGTIRTDSPYKYNWGSSAPMAKPETGDYSTSVSKSDLIARQRKADEIGSQADKILQMKPIGTSNSQISWYQSLTPEELNVLKQSKYASKLQPIEAQIRIADSNEANKQGFIAGLKDPELMKRQSQAIGDKLGIPFVPDAVDPLTYIGQMASNLGSVPSDIQRGNYSNAALNVVEPLAVGAIGTVGAKNTRQWVNNIVNPLAGIKYEDKYAIKNIDDLLKLDDDSILNYTNRDKDFWIGIKDQFSKERVQKEVERRLFTANKKELVDAPNYQWSFDEKSEKELLKTLDDAKQKQKEWLDSEEWLRRRMIAASETKGEATEAASLMKSYLRDTKSQIKDISNFDTYSIGNATYDEKGNPIVTLGYDKTWKDDMKLFGEIANHEFIHTSNGWGTDYTMKGIPFQKIKKETNDGVLVSKIIDYLNKPEEMQVRGVRALDFLKSKKLWENGDISEEAIRYLKHNISELPHDVAPMVSNLNDNQLRTFLNGVYSTIPAIGITAATQQNQVGGISDNDKNSNEITQNNSNLNWIQRGLFPEKYPYLTEGSDKKTHRLATAGFDDGTMVFPTIVQNKDRSLVEFDIDKALDYAMKTNTGVMVKDPQLADYYSKNGLIKHYQTGVKVTNYVKPIVPLQKYLTIDTIVPQQVNPIVSTPLVQRVKQTLFPSNIVTPVESGYSSHSKASDKIYEQQTGGFNHNTFNKILYGDMQSGGVNSLFPSTTILNQQDIVRKELQDYFKSLGKTNATKRLNDMKNEYVSSNNNMNTKYQLPLIQEAYLIAYPVEMVPKSKSKRY